MLPSRLWGLSTLLPSVLLYTRMALLHQHQSGLHCRSAADISPYRLLFSVPDVPPTVAAAYWASSPVPRLLQDGGHLLDVRSESKADSLFASQLLLHGMDAGAAGDTSALRARLESLEKELEDRLVGE